MRLNSHAAYLALTTLLLAGTAMAQTPPPAGTPPAGTPTAAATQAAAQQATPESRAEAKTLADVVGIPQQSRGILASMRAQMVASTQQSSGKSRADSEVIVDEVLMPDFNAAAPELVNLLVEAWAMNFTADELKTLHRFYETPVGAKMLKTLSVVGQESAQASQAWGRRQFQLGLKTHTEELHKRGLQF